MGRKQEHGWQSARYSDHRKRRIHRRQTATARAKLIDQKHAEEITEALREWGEGE